MHQIEGKEKILKVAEELIVKKGYNAVSARKIAREAKMSVGTLYHHFPNGKLSILYEIILSHRNEFIERFDLSKIEQLSNPEIAKDHLIKLIEQYRQFAPLIKGFEVELLTNKKLIADLENLLIPQESRLKKLFTDIILRFYPDIKEPEKAFSTISRIFTSIIYTHVIFENFYGTDEELVEILYKMLDGLLKSD